MRGATHEAELWRLLAWVRGVRVRRRLRALVEARRRERLAAAAVAEQIAALERHAEERLRVLTFCRRDQRAGAQWHATLRAHDGVVPTLHWRLQDMRQAHEAARLAAGEALRNWSAERVGHDDAKDRLRVAVARVARGDQEGG